MISMIVGGHRYTGGPGRIYTRQPDPDQKACRLCLQVKPIAEFAQVVWTGAAGRRGEYAWRETRCRECALRVRRFQRVAGGEEARLRLRQNDRNEHRQIRADVIQGYGGKCACCGEDRDEFLSIDHIEGNGKEHRRAVGGHPRFYSWIVKNDFPAFLRLLCFNCNLSRGFSGYCPHERERVAAMPSPPGSAFRLRT